MSSPAPTFSGWYPDADSGGTKYWDGSHWTGDTRPRRRPFAPASGFGPMGILVIIIGGLWVPISLGAFGETQSGGYIVSAILVPLAAAAIGVYLFRGQGPTTQEVETRLAGERKAVKAKRRAANLAGFAANLTGFGQSRSPAPPTTHDSAAAAQINAIANPETAKALQNLQNLLFTRAITDAEYKAAKDKLVGTLALTDSFAQIAQLAELHDAGILGDVEFAAAKARALGL